MNLLAIKKYQNKTLTIPIYFLYGELENVQSTNYWSDKTHERVQTDIWTGPSLSPNWAEVSTCLLGQDIQLCRPCNNTALHASGASPQT